MINTTTLQTAANLKKTADAAYKVFKLKPTVDNASNWTNASRAFNDFCVETVTDLIEKDSTDKQEEILSKIDEYKTCQQCGAEVLYQISDRQFITNINFLEDFPGWCFDCLLAYCTTHSCEGCEVNPKLLAKNCPFSEVKKLYKKAN